MALDITNINRVSTFSANTQNDIGGTDAALSPNGNSLLFTSASSNLVSGDTNMGNDIFMRDLTTGTVTRLSLNAAGQEANAASRDASFAPDGSRVLFTSAANNLVEGQVGQAGIENIFIRDMTTGEVTRISGGAGGAEADAASNSAVWSPDGTHVAFQSNATNLVADDTNAAQDIFLTNVATGETQRVSTSGTGVQSAMGASGPAFSPDGTKLAFVAAGDDVVAGDANNMADIVVKDLITGETRLVSAGVAGEGGNGAVSGTPVWSADGTKIAFASAAGNIVDDDRNDALDVFVHDLTTGETARVSETAAGRNGNQQSFNPVFMPDGQSIAFASMSDNLVRNDDNEQMDVFVKNLATGEVSRINALSGLQSDNTDINLAFTPDNQRVVFSGNTAFDPRDTNEQRDIFVGRLANDAALIQGTDGDDVLRGTDRNQRISGADGNDILSGGGGRDILTGGNGADSFNLTLAGNRASTIRDFNTAEGDTLILEDVLVGFDPQQDAIADFVTATPAGGNMRINIDADGADNMFTAERVAVLSNVDNLDVTSLYTQGQLVIQNTIT